MSAPWIETCRGTVFPWHVDNTQHFTVACYLERVADAGEALLDRLGLLGACVTVDCYLRYTLELRVGDIYHVTSAVIGVEADGLVLGHKLVNSETEALCTTIEQTVRPLDRSTWTPRPLPAAARGAAGARQAAWDGPPRERRPRPASLEGFRDTARDTVKPWEIDAAGGVALSAYVHRFSAANAHALAGFGMTPGYLRDARRGFSTFEFQLGFSAPLGAGARIGVRTGLLHVGTSSVRLLHVMLDEATGVEVASLEQFGVHLDLDARRPAPLPQVLRDKAQALLVSTP